MLVMDLGKSMTSKLPQASNALSGMEVTESGM